ncbi:MAG TPA: (Fe-S)-binding protein [Nitrosospira sp.]|nr:(Fe-S)-binding protein [Nitrosospira sp.]
MNPVDLPPELSAPVLSDELRAEIAAEANRCVACGLCLPHCPTYRITQSEADSPRGRIALMGGAMNGRIPVNARFTLHMDRCLTCRACEAACPSGVHFGELIDKTRALLDSPGIELPEAAAGKWSRGLRKLLMRELIAKPERIEILRPFFRLYQTVGLQKWLRHFRLLGSTRMALLESQLRPIDKPYRGEAGGQRTWQEVYPSKGKQRGEVGLFLGCIARVTDTPTINAAIKVLNRLGYTVHVPSAQTCCGALYQHGGELEEARNLVNQNLAAFESLDLQAIITTASGCGAHLAEQFPVSSKRPSGERREAPEEREVNVINSSSKNGAGNVIARITDISAFLAQAEGWDEVRVKPLPYKIAVHEPCTLRNILRGSSYPYKLLARIPDARVVPLEGNDQCCGAAGTYFLDQPEMAKPLLDSKLATLMASNARYLATSNVGCAMHIAGGARQAGMEIEVVHPVTLLARQMV